MMDAWSLLASGVGLGAAFGGVGLMYYLMTKADADDMRARTDAYREIRRQARNLHRGSE